MSSEKIRYLSSRNVKLTESDVSWEEAVLKGLAEDNGLFCPTFIPFVKPALFDGTSDFFSILFEILDSFFCGCLDELFKKKIKERYANTFDHPLVAPVTEKKGIFFLELFHGPTLSFKDIALTVLPELSVRAQNRLKIKEKPVILTATSGDTGSAAIEAFKDNENFSVFTIYPLEGVSEIQKIQMITSEGKSIHAAGIKGNFDDAQKAIKKILSDRKLSERLKRSGLFFSSANSINIGRLIPQIAYYFSAYSKMVSFGSLKMGEKVTFAVPTGNFGDILAGFYAKKMGLPVKKLICASNANNVLSNFFKTGIYDIRRPFYGTLSPAMDILISSNFERLLFEISDRNPEITFEFMSSLNLKGICAVNDDLRERLQDFHAECASDKETLEAIKKVYSETGYILDPHTAVAYVALEKYNKSESSSEKVVIISTASPYKFPDTILKALADNNTEEGVFEKVRRISKLGKSKIPEKILCLEKKEILHKKIINVDEIETYICNSLKI